MAIEFTTKLLPVYFETSSARVFKLASQPRDLIGLDRIFEGLLPLFAGFGRAPGLAQHVAEVFVDGRIPSGINRGFFQILARLLDVAQLEMSPAEAVEEAPLCRVDRDRLLDQLQGLLVADAAFNHEIAEVVERRGVVRFAFEQFAERLLRVLVLAGPIHDRAELDQRLRVIRAEFERLAGRLFRLVQLTRLHLHACEDDVNAGVLGRAFRAAPDHRTQQVGALFEELRLPQDYRLGEFQRAVVGAAARGGARQFQRLAEFAVFAQRFDGDQVEQRVALVERATRLRQHALHLRLGA